jgi:peptide subunit release factor 1 (eRF1)
VRGPSRLAWYLVTDHFLKEEEMIRQEDMQELLAFDAGEAKVVSLYLNADTSQQTSETIKLQVRGMLKDANGLSKDIEAIEHYLDYSHDWGIPGLALFSCNERDFFRVYPSSVAFRNRLRVGNKPYVKPLTHLLDNYGHYGVVVVDRIGARFFEYHLGQLKDSNGAMGDDVRKQKLGGGSARSGGASSATGQRGGQGGRHEEEVVQRNLRESAAAAEQFFAAKPIRRLFIGGTAENVAQFRDYLSKKLQSCIAGTFAIDMTAGEHEVSERTLSLLSEANADREQKLVESLITTAAKGANAVVGLNATLKMVGEGRVQTLVVIDGFSAPGYIHESSQFLVAKKGEPIPFDDEGFVQVDDVVDEAVSRTMIQGGQVEIIDKNQQLEESGRIGAILRY